MLLRQTAEPSSILEARGRIVNRAWSDQDDQPVVFSPDNARDISPAARDRFHSSVAQRYFFEEDRRRQERLITKDAKIGGALHSLDIFIVPYGSGLRAAIGQMLSDRARIQRGRFAGRRSPNAGAIRTSMDSSSE